MNKLEIDNIFSKWVKVAENNNPEQVVANNKTASDYPGVGPLPITIEQYKNRQTKNRTRIEPPKSIPKKQKRGGKQFQKRKEIALLYKKFYLETNSEEKITIKEEIKKIRKN